MYRCGLCNAQIEQRQPLRFHTIYREAPVADAYRKLPRSKWGAIRMEIAREIPACQQCLTAIAAGVDLHELISEARKLRVLDGQNGKIKLMHPLDRRNLITNGRKSSPRFIYSPPPTSNSLGDDDRSDGNDPPKCDICGMDASDGQVTADTVLCPFHCKKAMGK